MTYHGFFRIISIYQVFTWIFEEAHGGCSSGVEYKIVDLVVAGSKPVIHPNIEAFVAQLDRAPDFESVGRRFESCRTQ